MDEPQPIDDELLRMSGNPKIAQSIKDGLRRLSNGAAGPDLAEMAKDLLAGRITLGEVGRSSVFGEQISEGFAKFEQWHSELSPEEREEWEKKAREELGDPES